MDHTHHPQPSTPAPSTPAPSTPPSGGLPADLLARLTAAGVSLDDLTHAGLVRAEASPDRSLARQVALPADPGPRPPGPVPVRLRDLLHRTVSLPQRYPRSRLPDPVGRGPGLR